MKTISRRKALTGMGTLAGLSVLSGCAVNPVTGKREFMLMSEGQEISMGNEAHGQIVSEYGSYSDTAVQDWFVDRGNEMSLVTHRKQLPWKFTVLDSPVVNAFAVPGGYVYVTRGILGYFNNEAQLAGVLGHELGHVTARHSVSRYSKAKLATAGLALGSAVSEEFAKYAQFASLGTQLLFLKFSRDNERQADKLGVEYSSAVGYDSTHMSDFFLTLERMHPGGGSLPAWQSTHPDPGDRINATKKMSLDYQRKHTDITYKVERESYLDRINGLIFDADPRQGYVKDNMFYHPEMKFQFPVPSNWSVSNLPKEVRIAPEKQEALLIFQAVAGATPQDAAAAFAEKNGVEVAGTSQVTSKGLTGVKSSGKIVNGEQTLGINSYYFKVNDQIFVFHGISKPESIASYDASFSSSATGFGPITDKKFIDVSPKKVNVRQTKSKMTLQSAFNAFGVPEDEIARLAVINGMELTDELDAGARVKIIA